MVEDVDRCASARARRGRATEVRCELADVDIVEILSFQRQLAVADVRIPVPARVAERALQAGVAHFRGVGDFEAAITQTAQTQSDGARRTVVAKRDAERIVVLVRRDDQAVTNQVERIGGQLLMRHHLVVEQFNVRLDAIRELVVAQQEHAGALIRDQVIVTDCLEIETVGRRFIATEIASAGWRGLSGQLVAGQSDRRASRGNSGRRTGRNEVASTGRAR